MKILFLTRLFYPHKGGVEKHILNLSYELQKFGHEITVVTESHTKGLKKFETYGKINIHRVPIHSSEKSKKFDIWRWVVHNKNFINKFDIVHAHDVFYWALPLKIISPKLKIYTTFHGYEGNTTPNSEAKFMHKLAERLSESTMSIGSFYEKWYGTSSSSVSYGAVYRLYTEVKVSKKNISYVGRLEKEAGVEEYVAAFKIIYKKLNLHLNVYGDGALRKKIARQVKKNQLPISLHGWVDSPEEEIKNSSIIFTSRYLGILEAVAQGKFVVAVYTSEIKRDYLLSTPFAKYISIVNTPDEIASETLHFISNPNFYKEKIVSGQKWAINQTWEKLAKQYIKLWN